MEKAHISNSSDSSIYTLGQSGTQSTRGDQTKRLIMVTGTGTVVGNREGLKKRAKKKLITQLIILALIDIATRKGAKGRVKSYWNTYHCQSRLYNVAGKVYGKYCKNRFCTVCCGIRKAELINKYILVLKEWAAPYFVTLTIKSVSAKRLKYYIHGMVRAFRLIREKYKKRWQRGNGPKLKGFKTLESNFNPIRKTYNPHFHIIVPNKEIADTLIMEWLQIWTRKFTHSDAQYARPVRDKEKDLMEVVKYSSKIFTEPDAKKKNGKISHQEIYAAALDNIYEATKGLRIFERFGFNLPKGTQKKIIPPQWVKDYDELVYSAEARDWVNKSNEGRLSGYAPPFELLNLLEWNIDVDNE